MKKLLKIQKDWHEENEPLGKEFGYPDCCIREFGLQPPALMRRTKPNKFDKRRYRAACIDGEFTGFVPCREHARRIIAGEITINELIYNRNDKYNEFPNG